MKIAGAIESLDFDDRGGKMKIVGHSKTIWIDDLLKRKMRDFKVGDTITVEANEGRWYDFLKSVEKGGEAAPASSIQGPQAVPSASPGKPPPKSSEFNIPYSAKKIGQLYPILVDREGNIIDGLHRHKYNPEWRKEVVVWVQSRKDFLIARAHANYHRRDTPKAERQALFTELANIYHNEGVAIGELASTIAEALGFGEGYVRELLPRSLKLREKQKAGKLGGEARSATFNVAQGVTQPETLPDARVPLTSEGFAKMVREAPSGPIDLSLWSCAKCHAKYRVDWERMTIEPA